MKIIGQNGPKHVSRSILVADKVWNKILCGFEADLYSDSPAYYKWAAVEFRFI